jgi:hypothetical protein
LRDVSPGTGAIVLFPREGGIFEVFHGRSPAPGRYEVAAFWAFDATGSTAGPARLTTLAARRVSRRNLGHEQVLTTFSSYGNVRSERQAELMRRMGQKGEGRAFDQTTLDRVVQALKDANARTRQ